MHCPHSWPPSFLSSPLLSPPRLSPPLLMNFSVSDFRGRSRSSGHRRRSGSGRAVTSLQQQQAHRPSGRRPRVPSSVRPSVSPSSRGNLPRPLMLLSCTSKAESLIHKFEVTHEFLLSSTWATPCRSHGGDEEDIAFRWGIRWMSRSRLSPRGGYHVPPSLSLPNTCS